LLRRNVVSITEVWELLGHEKISDTVTAEWLSDTVCLLRFLFPEPNDLPYRGTVTAHIFAPGLYEYKGMVFVNKESATLLEHRDIKGYFRKRGLKGVSKRLKNGNVITKEYA
jgi:hypothetical protein